MSLLNTVVSLIQRKGRSKMKSKGRMVLVTAIVVILPLSAIATELKEDIEAAFPLAKGTYWIYEGTVKWTEADKVDADGKVLTWKVFEKTLTWKMEVTEAICRGHLTAALLKGHPGDLVGYDKQGRSRSDYLIIRVGPGKFYELSRERAKEALRRLRDEKDLLHGLLKRYDEPFFDLPLVPGKTFGLPERVTRRDTRYCWAVESEDPVQLKQIKEISPSRTMTQYRLTYRTNPDHVIVDFVPGIGITRYIYEHHGTPMEIDLKLIEFHPARG